MSLVFDLILKLLLDTNNGNRIMAYDPDGVKNFNKISVGLYLIHLGVWKKGIFGKHNVEGKLKFFKQKWSKTVVVQREKLFKINSRLSVVMDNHSCMLPWLQ